jgi:hypothetical protein
MEVAEPFRILPASKFFNDVQKVRAGAAARSNNNNAKKSSFFRRRVMETFFDGFL